MGKLSLAISMALIGTSALSSVAVAGDSVAAGSQTSKSTTQLQKEQAREALKAEIDKELKDVMDSGLVSEYGLSAYTPNELSQLEAKVQAIEKRVREKEILKPYLGALYDANAEMSLDDFIRSRLGFTPEQWKLIRKKEKEVLKAKNAPITDVKIRIREETLDNGSVDPINISVVKGYATAVVFVDAAGNPWPIEGDVTGDGSSYESTVTLSHVAVIDNINEFVESNALVNLKDMDIPLVISLKSSNKISDSRVIIHIPMLGPNTSKETTDVSFKTSQSNEMKELLNTGTLVKGREFAFKDIKGSAFLKDGWMYIRTKQRLMIPIAEQQTISPTGYKVYKIPPANDFLFIGDDGNRISTSISHERSFKVKFKSSILEQ